MTVLINLTNDDDAAGLDAIYNAQNNPAELHITLHDGPISSSVAFAVELLLNSNERGGKWAVEIVDCWPVDRETSALLSQVFENAFRRGRISKLHLVEISSSDEGREMLIAVFGKGGDVKNDQQKQRNCLELSFRLCFIDPTMMIHLQKWAQQVATVSKLTIEGDCFLTQFWPASPSEMQSISKMFQCANERPAELELTCLSHIGSMECLKHWSLDSISIIGNASVKGVESNASTLKNLKIFSCDEEDISMTLGDIGRLLQDCNCRLESLILSARVPVRSEYVVDLFKSLQHCHSPKYLHLQFPVNDPVLGKAIVSYLCSNPALLRFMTVDTSLISGFLSKIPLLLSSKNHFLEKLVLLPDDIHVKRHETKLRPYTMRNWAGRRILMESHLSPSLMVEVIVRVQQLDIKSKYCVEEEEVNLIRTDSVYHLIREGLSFLVMTRKRC